MAKDNASNDWGRNYVYIVGVGSSQTKPLGELKELLKSSTNNIFSLQKCMLSGSDYNMWAAVEVCSQKDAGKIMYAVGLYISGNNSAQQEFSTMNYSGDSTLGYISDPTNDEDCNYKARHNTLPLPYYIVDRDEAYKAVCLEQIWIILTTQKINGTPIVGIVMELILAGNGGILSKEFLKKLGKLGKLMEFKIIVDEILTWGRCSEKHILLVLDSRIVPQEFLDIVSHVTIGKWGNLGIVLCQPKLKFNYCTYNLHSRIEDRISGSCAELYRSLKYVVEKISCIVNRRAKLLKYLGVKEEDAWCMGLLIVCNVGHKTNEGMKNRYLPMLEESEFDFDKIPIKKNDSNLDCNKNEMYNKIMDDIKKWVKFFDDRGVSETSNYIYLFSKYLLTETNTDNEDACDEDDVDAINFKAEEWQNHSHNKCEQTIHSAQAAVIEAQGRDIVQQKTGGYVIAKVAAKRRKANSTRGKRYYATTTDIATATSTATATATATATDTDTAT